MKKESGNEGGEVGLTVKRSTRKRKASQKVKETIGDSEVLSISRARKPSQSTSRIQEKSEASSDESYGCDAEKVRERNGPVIEKQSLRRGEDCVEITKRRRIIDNSEEIEQVENSVPVLVCDDIPSQNSAFSDLKKKLEEVV